MCLWLFFRSRAFGAFVYPGKLKHLFSVQSNGIVGGRGAGEGWVGRAGEGGCTCISGWYGYIDDFLGLYRQGAASRKGEKTVIFCLPYPRTPPHSKRPKSRFLPNSPQDTQTRHSFFMILCFCRSDPLAFWHFCNVF